jgi:hypothetical protein
VKSQNDIQLTRASETHFTLSELRVEDFPALARFHGLTEVRFDGGGTDEKMEALAKLGAARLDSLALTDCPLVTDRGIEQLCQIHSLRRLAVRGTSMTDQGVETIATMAELRVVVLNNTPSFGFDSLLKLAQSKSIEEMTFPLGSLTQDNMLQIINAGRHLRRISVYEFPEGRLDATALRQAARAKRINLFVLRDMRPSPL